MINSNIWLKVKMKVTQLCLTLCNPMDYIVRGILQARILHFSRVSSQYRDQTQVSSIASRFLTSWATWESQEYRVGSSNNQIVLSESIIWLFELIKQKKARKLFYKYACLITCITCITPALCIESRTECATYKTNQIMAYVNEWMTRWVKNESLFRPHMVALLESCKDMVNTMSNENSESTV